MWPSTMGHDMLPSWRRVVTIWAAIVFILPFLLAGREIGREYTAPEPSEGSRFCG